MGLLKKKPPVRSQHMQSRVVTVRKQKIKK
jgi:hypothetical protein